MCFSHYYYYYFFLIFTFSPERLGYKVNIIDVPWLRPSQSGHLKCSNVITHETRMPVKKKKKSPHFGQQVSLPNMWHFNQAAP